MPGKRGKIMGEEVEVSLGGKKLFEYLSICLFTHRRLIHHFDRGTKVKKLPHKFTEIICIILSMIIIHIA